MCPFSPTATKRSPEVAIAAARPGMPVACGVQAAPSGEVATVPLPARATNKEPLHARSRHWSVLEVMSTDVHCMPSGDSQALPSVHAAANWVPVQMTLKHPRAVCLPDVGQADQIRRGSEAAVGEDQNVVGQPRDVGHDDAAPLLERVRPVILVR